MDLSVLTPEELAQYNEDIKKGLQVGSVFWYGGGYSNQNGTFVVTKVFMSQASTDRWNRRTPAKLCVTAKRVVDAYGQRIKNSKVTRNIEVQNIHRIVTEDSINRDYESEMKRAHDDLASNIRHAEEKRTQLLLILLAK